VTAAKSHVLGDWRRLDEAARPHSAMLRISDALEVTATRSVFGVRCSDDDQR